MNREIRKLSKKIDELQKLVNHNSDCIMEQSIIIHKLIEKLVGHSPYLDERFTGPIQNDKWRPYKGPDCEVVPIRDEDNICGGARVIREATPVYHVAYDGTKTTLPITI